MPPDSAAPSAVPPKKPRFTTFESFLAAVAKAGTTECECGGPLCPGTLARAVAARPEHPPAPTAPVFTPESPTHFMKEKRRKFEREFARLINAMSLEKHFGNRPDFALASDVWEFLESRAPSLPAAASVGFTGDPGGEVVSAPESHGSPGPKLTEERRPTREELINAMHAAATRIGYRIVEVTPFA